MFVIWCKTDVAFNVNGFIKYFMRVVFGIKHFKIKSYSLQELGLSESENKTVTIEKRQQYFHLYWIPFFALGQIWVLRKDDEMFDLPAEYETALNAMNIKHRTPFYTFALPLLIILGGLIYYASEKVNSFLWHIRAENEYNQELLVLNEKISHPVVGDYYAFQDIIDYTGERFFKVVALKGNSILLQMPERTDSWYSNKSGELASRFSDNPDSLHLAWMKVDDLKSYVSQEYSDDEFTGTPLPFRRCTGSYQLEKVYHFSGPEFVDIEEGRMDGSYFEIKLMNEGLTTSVTDIKIIDGNVKWLTELPYVVSANEKFHLVGTSAELPVYTIELTCANPDSTYSKYRIKGRGIDRKLVKL